MVRSSKEKVQQQDVEEALKNTSQEAITKGILGVRIIIYDGELFWGNDQFEYLPQVVNGVYKSDADVIHELVGLFRGSLA